MGEGWKRAVAAAKATRRSMDAIETHDLRQAVRDYISEIDNPVPDYGHRRVLRNRLRELAGCPPEPQK
jgi:hypothetical protein